MCSRSHHPVPVHGQSSLIYEPCDKLEWAIQIPLGPSPVADNRRRLRIVCTRRVDNYPTRYLICFLSGSSRAPSAKGWGERWKNMYMYIQDMHDSTSNAKGYPLLLLTPVQHNGSRKIGQSFFAGVHSSTFTCWISYAAGQDSSFLFPRLLFFFAVL